LRFTLPKSLFFQKADFESLFKTGKKKFGSFFVIYSQLLTTDSENSARIGAAVSKKSTGPSVRRNLVKRLIREKYRLQQHDLPHLQVLVVTKKEIKAKHPDRIALKEDLDRLFAQL
jgi:ribonuclease P protein component